MKLLNEFIKTRKGQQNIAFLIRHLFTLFIILLQIKVFAQREFSVCDSTSYTLNADTTIIAGRNHLYLHTNNTITTLYNFSSSNTIEYIRDFDIIKPDLWFTIVGSKYIGSPTRLYKSINRGITWTLDTNHHHASNSEFLSQPFLASINNLQHLNGDTLIMFMHYYESGIIYSTDLGLTWTKWFDNLISHYQGMFECDNQYYLFGYAGDGFRASMFGFDKSLLFTTDSTGLWINFNPGGYHPPCYNGTDTANCIFAPNHLTRCETYHYFKNKIDSICTPLIVIELKESAIQIYPNPFTNKMNIEGTLGEEMYRLTNVYGQTVWVGKRIEQQEFYHLSSGIFFLTILNDTIRRTFKLIKE